jgi:tRNA(Ile)-lysidine synthase
LRGVESERDEQFVRDLAKRLNVVAQVKKFDTASYASANNCSIQEAARELRYGWFEELMQAGPFAFTALAHHANDNVETVIMNFFRGTGLEGLAGMKKMSPRGRFIRPMLDFTRVEIENHARENELDWVEDSSNLSSKYTRNYFRNELIPSIQKVYPQVNDNMLDNIRRFRHIYDFYQSAIREIKKKLVERRGSEDRIPVRKLLKHYSVPLLYEILSDYGFGEKSIGELDKLLHSESGKFMANDRYQVIRHREWIIIAPKTPEADTIAVEEGQATVCFPEGKIHFRVQDKDQQIQAPDHIARLDIRNIRFPLILRRWRQGDYFYPLGMRKKKKLARFLTDSKLSRNRKEKTWVLESEKRILWVVGMRIDDRFKITDSTQSLLVITYEQ